MSGYSKEHSVWSCPVLVTARDAAKRQSLSTISRYTFLRTTIRYFNRIFIVRCLLSRFRAEVNQLRTQQYNLDTRLDVIRLKVAVRLRPTQVEYKSVCVMSYVMSHGMDLRRV